MTAISEAATVSDLLANVDLEGNDFSLDTTCNALADLIDKGSALYDMNLINQIGDRPIYVTYTPATSAEAMDGLIRIEDRTTQDVILERSTAQTNAFRIDQGDY